MNQVPANSLDQQLEQLRDIRLPEELAWWILAPGWWMLTAILCLALVMFWRLRKKQRNAVKYLALLELERIKNNQQDKSMSSLAADLNVLLHRTVISLDSDQTCTCEFGRAWETLLTSKSKKMPEHVARILTLSPYAKNKQIQAIAEQENVTATDLIKFTGNWIRSYA